eukprot:11019186-Ditylum_brightwellii.AAC.1
MKGRGGKHQIAGVWCSPELAAENSMLLPFGFGIGDHRLILIDIPTKHIIGHNIPTIERPKAHGLLCFSPKVRDHYITYLLLFARHHMILEKYETLVQDSTISIDEKKE